MREHRQEDDRLDHLVGALREGRLSEAEAAELRQLLRSQSGARRRFAEHMFLAATLKHQGAEPWQARSQAARLPLLGNHRATWAWFGAGVALAAAILLPLVVLWSARSDQASKQIAMADFVDPGVAVLAEAVDARWADAVTSVRVGTSLPPGHLKLEKGWVRIDFYSGASVVLEGRADLELISPMESILHRGTLQAHVPTHAHGFVVRTGRLKVVDLGTSFGMRVDAGQGTEVHVFEGKVQLHESASGTVSSARRELVGGAGLRIGRDGSASELRADAGEFTSWRELEHRADKDFQQRFQNWRHASSTLARDPRLIAYYPFHRDPARPRQLINESANREERLAGSIVGCVWSQGRWPGKDAIEFKRPGDRVRIEVPGVYRSLTLTAWVRPDSLDHQFNSLLLSDGWHRRGAVHWQLLRSGQLSFSVWDRPGVDPDVRTRAVLDPYDLGRWMHLATVYDGPDRSVSLYLNGQRVCSQPLPRDVPLSIGAAEIGNWSTLNFPDLAPIRNFNGRLDELAIFSSPLDASEIQHIYRIGKP